MGAPWLGLPIFAAVAVAIELPPDASEEAAARVIKSCQAALGPDQCTLATDDSETRWHAAVTWEGMRLIVLLEDSKRRGSEVARREIEFSPSDSEEQRWVAAGLMVAAVTAAQSQPEAAKQQETPAEQAVPRRQPVIVAELPPTPTAPRGAVDVGGLIGRGLRASEPKLGLLGRGWLMLRPSPLGATAALRIASSFGDPELRWYGGSAGLAGRVTDGSSPFGLEFRGELLVEQAQARATREGVQQIMTSSWRGGAELGMVASYRLARWLVPWVAADISAVRPELEVRVGDESAGSEGDVRWAFSLGVRFHLSREGD